MIESSAHERRADDDARRRPVRCAVLTVSDTRTDKTDESGPIIVELLGQAGHEVVANAIVPDEPQQVTDRLSSWIADDGIDVIIATGGTGFAPRDVTVDVVRSLFDTEIEGFGELFRVISHRDIGASAMLSRATAGLVRGSGDGCGDTYVFAIPGSTNAARTAVAELIAPQIAHLVWLRRA